MNDGGPDVHATLEYRSATTIVRLLPTGLLLIFLGLALYVLAGATSDHVGTDMAIVLCLAAGSGVIGVALWTRARPGKPNFTLSPAGIQYRIPWVKEFLIPWSEVQGVDTIDIVTRHWSPVWLFVSHPSPLHRYTFFRDVTVVQVSKHFYDARIFVDSFFLRGPGWKANFIAQGALVQTALHHELVSVEPQALRQAVEARWHAFRGQTAIAPTSKVIAMGDNPRAISRWESIKIIVPLIGIAVMLANLVGLWELQGKGAARDARAKARQEQTYWRDATKRMQEEWKKRDVDEKERRRQFDEDMRRAFGR
jgi:hypothetical protein